MNYFWQNFLLQDEVKGLNEKVAENPEKDKEIIQNGDTELQTRNAVTVKNVEARWIKDNANPDLKDITLAIRKCQLLGVIGTVGSGKVSLLTYIFNVVTENTTELLTYFVIFSKVLVSWIIISLFDHNFEETRFVRLLLI